MKKTAKIYLVYIESETGDYWTDYPTLAEAVLDNEDENGVEIYEAIPKLVGTYKVFPKITKMKHMKKSKND